MTTRRERLERKIEKREEWAAKAAARADRAYQTSQVLVANIPMGQPVLVGHHSEKSHRRALDRSWNAMGKSVAETELAAHHRSAAAGLAAQLERTIFTDDADALENLAARIAENEAKRDQMKKVNALYRKGDAAGLAALGFNLASMQKNLAEANSWERQPYASYELTNLGARIRSDKQRLAEVERRRQRAARAEASPSGVALEGTGEYVRVVFAEKPARALLDALKAAGFHWSGGGWCGRRDALPASVSELLPEPLHGAEAFGAPQPTE